MILLDRHASISHVGAYIQACTQETCECWDRKVDGIVCGNTPAKLRMHCVTVLYVQSTAWYMECTRYGNASPPSTTSQPHFSSLYCDTSTRFASVLCKSCGVVKHHGMQSTEHRTGGCTKLYVLTTCCTVRNTRAGHFRETLAE